MLYRPLILGAPLFAAFALVAPTAAHAEPGGSEEADEAAFPEADEEEPSRSRGSASLGVYGGPAFRQRHQDGAKTPLAFDFGIVLAIARFEWPVSLGLGVGATFLEQQTRDGPTVISFYDGSLVFDELDEGYTVDLRRIEAIVRLQPFGGSVRPYAEASAGLAVLHTEILGVDSRDDLGALFGATVGAEIELVSFSDHATRHSGLFLTVGVRRTWTTAFDRVVLGPAATGRTVRVVDREPLRLWMPFLGLAISVRDRPADEQR
ncbi:MAG TPA: hypothetical protein VKY73_07605 [Polyangiaceae bacterium]|nr:hypothetical protein [Polyangiaceae bacterium]